MAQYLRPNSSISAVQIAGGDYTSIDETTAVDTPAGTEFIYGNENQANVYEAGLSAPENSPNPGLVIVRYRMVSLNGTSPSVNALIYGSAQLLEGTTTLTADPVTHTLAASWTTYAFTLSTGLISDFSNLRLRLTGTDSGGNPSSQRATGISWAEVEVPDGVPGPITASAAVINALGQTAAYVGMPVYPQRSYTATFLAGTVSTTDSVTRAIDLKASWAGDVSAYPSISVMYAAVTAAFTAYTEVRHSLSSTNTIGGTGNFYVQRGVASSTRLDTIFLRGSGAASGTATYITALDVRATSYGYWSNPAILTFKAMAGDVVGTGATFTVATGDYLIMSHWNVDSSGNTDEEAIPILKVDGDVVYTGPAHGMDSLGTFPITSLYYLSAPDAVSVRASMSVVNGASVQSTNVVALNLANFEQWDVGQDYTPFSISTTVETAPLSFVAEPGPYYILSSVNVVYPYSTSVGLVTSNHDLLFDGVGVDLPSNWQLRAETNATYHGLTHNRLVRISASVTGTHSLRFANWMTSGYSGVVSGWTLAVLRFEQVAGVTSVKVSCSPATVTTAGGTGNVTATESTPTYVTAGAATINSLGGTGALLSRTQIPGAAGTVVASGQAGTLLSRTLLPATVATVTTAGGTANVLDASPVSINATAATVLASGQSGTLRQTTLLPASAGAVVAAGQSGSLVAYTKIAATVGTVLASGQSASLRQTALIPATAGTVAASGQAASFLQRTQIPATAGTVVTSGTQANLSVAGGAICSAATAVVSGQTATIKESVPVSINATAASVATAGGTGALKQFLILPASAATVTTAGGTGAVIETAPIRVEASAATVTLAETTATINEGTTLRSSRRVRRYRTEILYDETPPEPGTPSSSVGGLSGQLIPRIQEIPLPPAAPTWTEKPLKLERVPKPTRVSAKAANASVFGGKVEVWSETRVQLGMATVGIQPDTVADSIKYIRYRLARLANQLQDHPDAALLRKATQYMDWILPMLDDLDTETQAEEEEILLLLSQLRR